MQSTSNNTCQTLRALTPRFTFTDAYAESEFPVLKIGEGVSIVLGTAVFEPAAKTAKNRSVAAASRRGGPNSSMTREC